MRGIVGYVGRRQAVGILIEGLRRLDHRGDESAGVVVQTRGGLASHVRAGRIDLLEAETRKRALPGCAGLGHTLWIAEGGMNGSDAGPYFSCDRKIAVVHSGVLENSAALRKSLEGSHRFKSESDSELISHLIEDLHARHGGDLLVAVNLCLGKVRGSLAIGVLHADHPNSLWVARIKRPLVVGLGEGENFLASDLAALLPHTRRIVRLNDHELARIGSDEVQIFDRRLHALSRPPVDVEWAAPAISEEGDPDALAREIGEQGISLATELAAWEDGRQRVRLPRKFDRIMAVACGSSYHAGLAAKVAIEECAGIPVEVAPAGEFLSGARPLGPGTLFLAISQSGETADTLASVRLARQAGLAVLGLTNGKESSLAREADSLLFMRTGPESGGISTKTYTSQILNLIMLALHLGRSRGFLPRDRFEDLLRSARPLPGQVGRLLSRDTLIRNCARKYQEGYDFMYLGLRYNFATACEGALKMKEMTRRATGCSAAGELRRGSLALVNHRTVCVAVASKSVDNGKTIANLREIRARGGVALSVAAEGDERVAEVSDHVLEIPACEELFSPILAAIPLQLLAYHRAIGLQRDLAGARGLPEPVTVE